VWVDGIHLKVRLEQDNLCLLVMIGVRADATKELVALSDGFRESSESWADLLRYCKRRGLTAPVLTVGDGALGFWKAIRDVFPDTREQRCWWHKIGNVLAALPKSAHPAAKKALAEIYNAENKAAAVKATHTFATEYGAKWPKAVAKIGDDFDVLTAFYDYPAKHWIHLCTANRSSRPSPPSGSATGHQGTRLPRRRRGDGLQTHRIRPGPLARGQRTPPGRPGPRRREVRERQTRRTTRRVRR
jgi:putative transposase